MLNSQALKTKSGAHSQLVLILLNYNLPRSTPLFWKRAGVRICADGGANRLYDAAPGWLPESEEGLARKSFLPTVIKGDLDSIRPEVAHFYSQHGTSVVDLSHDQDSTDLDKCLVCAEQRLKDMGVPPAKATILAVGAFGGRLDHTLSNVNKLYTHQHLSLILCGEGTFARLIPKGKTVIQSDLAIEGPGCSLVALGEHAVATSTGLKWNLDDHTLAVGGLMSTSNEMVSDTVTVSTTQPLLWTTDFKDDEMIDGLNL